MTETALANLAKFRADEKGATAIIVAVLFPFLLGGMGLGAETGYWYLKQRKLQHATDVAVHAAAVRMRAGDSHRELEAAARSVADASGLSRDIGNLEVNNPPTSGVHEGSDTHIEVVAEEIHARMFTSVFTSEPLRMSARAVASVEGGSSVCVLALSKSAQPAVAISGSTNVSLDGCAAASNSAGSPSVAVEGAGSAFISECLFAVGNIAPTHGLDLKCGSPVSGAVPTSDPYAHMPQPIPSLMPCRSPALSLLAGVFLPLDWHAGVRGQRICGGLDIRGNVYFAPGLYIIDGGDLTIRAGANVDARGATFFLTGRASANFSGNAEIRFEPPSSGPFSGVALYGDRRDRGVTHSIAGNTGSIVTGAIYAPSAHVTFGGNSAFGGSCAQVIADRVTFTGNARLGFECADAGMRNITAGQTVQIVE